MRKKYLLLHFILFCTFSVAGQFSDGEVLYEGVFNEDELNGEPWKDEKALIEYDQGFLDTTFYTKYHGNHDDSETLGLIGYSLGYGNGLTERFDEAGGERHHKHAIHNYRPWNQPENEFGKLFSTRIHVSRFDVRNVGDICFGGTCLVEDGHVEEDDFQSSLEEAENEVRSSIDANLEVESRAGGDYVSGELDFSGMSDKAKFGLGYLYTPELYGNSIIDEADVIHLDEDNEMEVSVEASRLENDRICLYAYGVQMDCLEDAGEEGGNGDEVSYSDIEMSFNYPGDELEVGETLEITAYVPEELQESHSSSAPITLDTDGGGTEWELTADEARKIEGEETVEIEIQNNERGELAARIAHNTDLDGRTTHKFKTVDIEEDEGGEIEVEWGEVYNFDREDKIVPPEGRGFEIASYHVSQNDGTIEILLDYEDGGRPGAEEGETKSPDDNYLVGVCDPRDYVLSIAKIERGGVIDGSAYKEAKQKAKDLCGQEGKKVKESGGETVEFPEKGWRIINTAETLDTSELNCGENAVAYYSDDMNRLQVKNLEDSGTMEPNTYFVYTSQECSAEITEEQFEGGSVNLEGFTGIRIRNEISTEELQSCGQAVFYTRDERNRLQTATLQDTNTLEPGKYFAYNSEECVIDLN